MNRRLSFVLVSSSLLLALSACESLGIKANITSIKSVNGQTEVKQREAKNWDEFKSAMSEVGTDFSDVAKQVGATTGELAKALVDAPPPGQVKLGDVDPGLSKYEDNDQLDFIAAARKKADAPYDFTYVQIGVPSYDAFFKTAAEVYATAFQLAETARRVKLASAALTGDEQPDARPGDAAKKAREAQPTDDNKDMAAYFEQLDAMWATMAPLSMKLVGRTGELIAKGQQLIAGAPASITNPKAVLHLKLIIKGLGQSVELIKDSAGIMGDLTGV